METVDIFPLENEYVFYTISRIKDTSETVEAKL